MAIAVAMTLTAIAAHGQSTPSPGFPPGTDIVSFELRDGLIHAQATMLSPSGHQVTGPLILDTGAPGLALRTGVIGALRLDTLVARSSMLYEWVHRPLESVEIGSASVSHVELVGAIADSLFGDAYGLFGPNLFGERGMVIDYPARRWVIVPRTMGFVSADTDVRGATNLDHAARLRRSRADFGAVVPAGARGVRFRLFADGRILLHARVEDPASGWASPPLTLLLDTGASHSVVFQDVMDERLGRAARWPWLRDVSVVTAYGVVRADQTILPRLVLTDAEPAMGVDRVEATAIKPEGLPSLSKEVAEPVDGLLGYTFLARYRIMVDYVNQILWLAPITGGTAPTSTRTGAASGRADVGIQLESRWGDTRVSAVRPGSPAERERVAFGDIVTSIDGVATSGLTLDAAQRMMEGHAGTEVVVIVRRGGMQQVLRLKRETAP